MKRLSLLFSLLLLCVGVAVAQRIVSIGDEVTDGSFDPHEHYIMKLVSYNDGTNDVNVEDQNLYFYTTEGARLKTATITLDDVSSSNYLLNMYSTSIEGVYTLGMGTTFITSFTSGSGGFNCSKNNKNYGGSLNAYKLHKQEIGGYILQGYRGSTAGLYLKYNKTSEQTEVVGSGNTGAMVVKIYKANTTFKEGKFYTLTLRTTARNVVFQHGLYASSGSTKSTNANGIWYFKKNVDAPCQWYIYNVFAGEDYPAHATTNNNSAITFDGVKTSFSVGKGDGTTNGFSFIVSGNAAVNDISGTLGVWNTKDACNTDGSTFLATEIDQTYANCTFTFTDATNNRSVVRHIMEKVGEVPSIPTLDFFTATTTSLSNVVTADGENNYTIEGSFKYPFTITNSDENATWYAMKVRINTQQRDVVVNENKINSQVYYSNVATNYDRFNDGLFRFVSVDNTGYFKIKNRNGKYLKSGGIGNYTDLVTTSNESEALAFEVRKNDFSGAAETDFSLLPYLTTSTSYVYGDHNGSSSKCLCLWTNGKTDDDGSRFRVLDANTTTDILNIGRNAEANALAAAAPSTYIGGYTTAAIEAFKAATYTSLIDIETKAAALGNDESNLQSANVSKYYRIQANRYTTPVYMSCDNTKANKSGDVQEGSGSNPDERRLGFSQTATASNLVQFESTSDGKFFIKDVNSGFYYGQKNEASDGDGKLYLVKNNTWAGKYSIAYSLNGNVAQVGLKENNATNVTSQYLYCSGSDATAAVGNNNYVQFHSPYTDNAETGTAATVDAGCVYKIAEVSTYPLTISAAKYASLCLPFSVTLPEGLTAYKVTSVTNGTDNREMDLTAIDGAIPANEPVIIGATAAGSFNLTINTDNTTAQSTDNWLTGATVKRTGIDEDYFALGYKALNSDDADTKTVGFFRVTTTNMPANKAYLLKSKIQESAANPAMVLMFNFGNVTTNINDAKTNEVEGSNTYYDLNGRRVLYPTHGIYVKGNGQKVFIK